MKLAFAPSDDISGPAPSMGAGIGPEAHELIGAHFKCNISDFKQLPRRCTARQHTQERDMRRLSRRRLYPLHFKKHRMGGACFDVPPSLVERSTESRGPVCYCQGRFLVLQNVRRAAILPYSDLL